MQYEFMPFYVGQKVVYITGLHLPKNSIYTVLEVVKFSCGCWHIDIGENVIPDSLYFRCKNHHYGLYKRKKGQTLFLASAFAPLEERFISFAEVIEIESPLIGAN